MKCDNANPQSYKKPTFLSKIVKFFDKLFGIRPEDYTTDEEARYIDQNFNKTFVRRRRKKN